MGMRTQELSKQEENFLDNEEWGTETCDLRALLPLLHAAVATASEDDLAWLLAPSMRTQTSGGTYSGGAGQATRERVVGGRTL